MAVARNHHHSKVFTLTVHCHPEEKSIEIPFWIEPSRRHDYQNTWHSPQTQNLVICSKSSKKMPRQSLLLIHTFLKVIIVYPWPLPVDRLTIWNSGVHFCDNESLEGHWSVREMPFIQYLCWYILGILKTFYRKLSSSQTMQLQSDTWKVEIACSRKAEVFASSLCVGCCWKVVWSTFLS